MYCGFFLHMYNIILHCAVTVATFGYRLDSSNPKNQQTLAEYERLRRAAEEAQKKLKDAETAVKNAEKSMQEQARLAQSKRNFAKNLIKYSERDKENLNLREQAAIKHDYTRIRNEAREAERVTKTQRRPGKYTTAMRISQTNLRRCKL